MTVFGILAFVVGCGKAALITSVAGGILCQALVAILGPAGQYWGTACQTLTQAIATEIGKDVPQSALAATGDACRPQDTVEVPGLEGGAWVCPQFLNAAKRAAASPQGQAFQAARAARAGGAK